MTATAAPAIPAGPVARVGQHPSETDLVDTRAAVARDTPAQVPEDLAELHPRCRVVLVVCFFHAVRSPGDFLARESGVRLFQAGDPQIGVPVTAPTHSRHVTAAAHCVRIFYGRWRHLQWNLYAGFGQPALASSAETLNREIAMWLLFLLSIVVSIYLIVAVLRPERF